MALVFLYQVDEEGNKSECHCCGFPAPLASFRGQLQADGTEPKVMLCEVCSGTYLSYAVTAPHSCQDRLLSQSIGCIANMILSEIRELKEMLKGDSSC